MNKKKVRTVLLVIFAMGLLGLLGMGISLYFQFKGTPWEAAAARKQAEGYLQKRFTQKMVIESGKLLLDFEHPENGYRYSVHPEGKNDFKIELYQVKRNSPDFNDDYYIQVWQTEVNQKIQAFLQPLYPGGIQNWATIQSANFDQFPQWGITSAPAMVDFQGKIFMYRLSIRVSTLFDKDHPDRGYERIYRVVQFLKESDLVPDDLVYGFGPYKKDQISIFYSLDRDEFQTITSKQTMMAILERHGQGTPSQQVFH